MDDRQEYRNSLTINFERGTVYRNSGPFPKTEETKATVELGLATHAKGRTIVHRKRLENALSGFYQWEAFHRALSGRELTEATRPEEIVAGLKIIAAMTRAERSGMTERV